MYVAIPHFHSTENQRGRHTALRILRITDPAVHPNPSTEHRFVKGHGGHRIDASRNMWNGSGLKIDSAATDVVWGRGCKRIQSQHTI